MSIQAGLDSAVLTLTAVQTEKHEGPSLARSPVEGVRLDLFWQRPLERLTVAAQPIAHLASHAHDEFASTLRLLAVGTDLNLGVIKAEAVREPPEDGPAPLRPLLLGQQEGAGLDVWESRSLSQTFVPLWTETLRSAVPPPKTTQTGARPSGA